MEIFFNDKNAMNLKTIISLNNRKKTNIVENDILLRCYYFRINSFLIDFENIVKNIKKSYFLTS